MKDSGTAHSGFGKEVKEVNDPYAKFIAIAIVSGIGLAMWVDMWLPPLTSAIQSFFGS